MPIFAIPILIIVAIFAISAGGDLIENIDLPFADFRLFAEKGEEKTQPKRTTSSPSQTTISQAPPRASPSPPPFLLKTIITQGPKEGATITNSNQVTFTFEGYVEPVETTGRITFETFMEGVDTSWKSTTSKQRKITLSPGVTEYTFFVRSKLDRFVDAVPAQRTFTLTISPFFGKIYMSSTKPATQSRPSSITLKPRLSSGETIDITNWKIQGRNGSFSIPLGIKKINPGVTAIPTDPLIVTRSETVKLTGAAGPFGIGKNYRPNICMGYLKNFYTFPLSFSSSCSFQKPHISQLLYFDSHCQDFVLKKINYSSCRVPTYPEDPNILQQGTAECATYLQENFNYSSCFAAYKDSENFTKSEWHVYMNNDFLRGDYDVVNLYDAKGLLVDTRIIQ